MIIYEQDFLMRQVQQLTQLLQQIIFKKNQNQYQEAVQEIQNTLQCLTNDKPKRFHELTYKETLELFVQRGNFESKLALAVADLLVEEGEILYHDSFDTSQKCFCQALLLYKKSLQHKNAAVPLDIHEKIDDLTKKIRPDDLVSLNTLLTN